MTRISIDRHLSSLSHQSRFRLRPLLFFHLPDLLSRTVESRIYLVERVLWTPLKLLPDDINSLLFSKALMLLF